MSLRLRSSQLHPTTLVGKGCVTAFFFVFLAMGLAFTGAMVYFLYEHAVTRMWAETACTIASSRVAIREEKSNAYWFKVTYAYQAGGRGRTSQSYRRGYSGSSDHADAARLVERYAEETKAVCFVNPSDPGEAVLEHAPLWVGLFILIPLVFVAVGAGGLYSTWRRGRRKKRADGSAAPEPISAAAGKPVSPWFLVLFCGVFFAIGTAVFVPMFVLPVLQVQAAKSWMETPCTIDKSRVKPHRSDDGTTYSVDVLYTYEFNGTRHRSSRYSFETGSSSGRASKKAVVDALPEGKATVCYVDPDDPKEAVLNRELTAGTWFGLIPLVFVLVGMVGMFFSARSALRRGAEPAADAAMGMVPLREAAGAPPGPVTLKAAGSPLGKLIGLLFFAVFWNGIVSVFVWEVVKGWSGGKPNWFLTLFLVPFVLIGLGAVGGVLYQFLALFNPRPRLVVTPGAASPGGLVQVRWEFRGSTGRIDTLAIVLEGREEARYRRGTSTYTDTEVFATLPIVEVSDRRDMVAGEGAVTLPADTMHTFKASNNKILWRLKVNGDIRMWPDVKEEFEFEVLPAPVGEGRRG